MHADGVTVTQAVVQSRSEASQIPRLSSPLVCCRPWLSMVLRAPFDAWVLFTQVRFTQCGVLGTCTALALPAKQAIAGPCVPDKPQQPQLHFPSPPWQDAPALGFGGALVSHAMPHQAKLLLLMVRAVWWAGQGLQMAAVLGGGLPPAVVWRQRL